MSWNIITTDQVKTRLAGAELTALQSAALANGQADPLPEIITQVVDEVRGYVAAGGFQLGTGTTIPSKLTGATLDIIRYRLATRLPARGLLTDERKEEYKNALDLLKRVADGNYVVEEPATPSDETSGRTGSWGSETAIAI